MTSDNFDDLYDQYMSKKRVTRRHELKEIGISNPQELPIWREVKKSSTNNICNICKRKLDDEDVVEVCPDCNYYFHYMHIREWLKIKPKCPVCKDLS